MPRLCSSLLLSLLITSSASAVTMAWTPIGNPGNACDPQSQGCFGGVSYAYNIGTYEVTNAQYVEFLNAKAKSDPLVLYNSNMSSSFGGITQSGTPGTYTYSTIAGREDWPVTAATFFDALRFANWMNNGQGSGDTEMGAYTLLGGTLTPTNGNTVMRNAGATILLTSENEWHKAAYYDPSFSRYDVYPMGSSDFPNCTTPTQEPNSANCYGPSNLGTRPTTKGSYPLSASHYGVFDMGGNVFEWNESISGSERGIRGGSFASGYPSMNRGSRSSFRTSGSYDIGFRLVMIPEPSTGLLVFAGLLGLAGWCRARA